MNHPDPDPGDQIRRLLAARREVPLREEYVDGFLSEFHRRQRSEMLRTSAWRLGWERLTAVFSEFQVPRTAYAGAFAAFVVAVLVTLNLPGERTPAAGATMASAAAAAAPSMRLGAGEVLVALPATFLPAQAGQFQANAALPPRYVLDARPVSYEPPFSF